MTAIATASEEERQVIQTVIEKAKGFAGTAFGQVLANDSTGSLSLASSLLSSQLLHLTQTDSIEEAEEVAKDYVLSQIENFFSNDDEDQFAQTAGDDLWSYDDYTY